MKQLKGMKTQNKTMLVTAVVLMGLIAGFSHISQVTAATEETDQVTLDYLDPFDLSVMMWNQEPGPVELGSVRPTPDMMLTGGIQDDGTLQSIAFPDRIWIPRRPVFRSPCTPSW